MAVPLRVGIVGARGIGKHHAKWFAHAGCEVTAVFGTTAESAAEAARGLSDLMGFSGRAYHDWEQFRRQGGFEAVSICSLAHAHTANLRDLADDGRQILCEKPLSWSWDWPAERILADGREGVAHAKRRGVLLGINAQYPAAVEGFEELHRSVLGREPEYESLCFVMETRGKQRSAHGSSEAWVDLGPHPLALLDSLAPGSVDWSTLRHSEGPGEAVVDFTWVSGDRRIAIHLECRRGVQGEIHRKLGNQDLVADYDGFNENGVFRARLRGGSGEWSGQDYMQTSIERFIQAVRSGDESRLLVTGEDALRQQEALVGVLTRCWPGILPAADGRGNGKENT